MFYNMVHCTLVKQVPICSTVVHGTHSEALYKKIISPYLCWKIRNRSEYYLTHCFHSTLQKGKKITWNSICRQFVPLTHLLTFLNQLTIQLFPLLHRFSFNNAQGGCAQFTASLLVERHIQTDNGKVPVATEGYWSLRKGTGGSGNLYPRNTKSLWYLFTFTTT